MNLRAISQTATLVGADAWTLHPLAIKLNTNATIVLVFPVPLVDRYYIIYYIVILKVNNLVAL